MTKGFDLPKKGRVGRPPKTEAARVPHQEIDKLLVEGEEIGGANRPKGRVWPSIREIARRFSISSSVVAEHSRKHDCRVRRMRYMSRFEGEREAQVATDVHTAPAAAASEDLDEVDDSPELDDAEPEVVRAPGRPKKSDAPAVSWHELDRLLVFGEVVAMESGRKAVIYPKHKELAERFNVSPGLISQYAQKHNCVRRREEAQARVEAKADAKLVELRATSLAVSKDHAVQIIDNYLLNFEKALAAGRIRFDSPGDFSTMVKTKELLMGNADSRQEVSVGLSLEDIQARHVRMLKESRGTSAAEQGIVDAEIVPDEEREEQDRNERPPNANQAAAQEGESAPESPPLPTT